MDKPVLEMNIHELGKAEAKQIKKLGRDMLKLAGEMLYYQTIRIVLEMKSKDAVV